MAPRKNQVATKANTEVVDWEAELAAQAQVAVSEQRSMGGGGKFVSMKAGVLAFDGNPMPGNQMSVIILADLLENSYYDAAYDPDVPASPKCFAFGRVEADMEPHQKVDEDDYFERQNDVCAGCPQGEWGSAPTGKGKACKNVMRLAIIPAGKYTSKGGRNAALDYEQFDDPDHFKNAEVAYIKLPVMSVKNYTTFVRQLAAETNRPPHGVVTNIYLTPDPKSQYRVNFEVLDVLGGDLMPTIMPRHKKEREAIDFPYGPPAEKEEVKPSAAKNKLAKKPAGRK